MKSQRGSVTVIAVVMLLFLMIIAVAWLPMMTMEKTAASSDYREQQAWYAAEAGYKRAVAALENKNNEWWWITPENYIQTSDSMNLGHLSLDGNKVDQEKIWYAVGIMKGTLDISGTYTPEDNVAYQITSIGSCQGIRKVIRKVYTLGDNGETGGGEEGGGEEVLDLPGLIQAGGTVTITNNQAGNLNGDLYGSGFFDSSGKQFADGHTQGAYPNTLKTHIPDYVFQKGNYENLNAMPYDEWTRTLDGSKNYFWDMSDYKNNWLTIVAEKSSGMTVFVDNSKGRFIGTIKGPTAGDPVTFIFTSDIEVNAPITGNVRIFAAKDFTFDNQAAAGLIMFMSNGEMKIMGQINKGFLSSDKNMTIANQSFYGQAQVRGYFKTTGTIHFDDSVLKAKGFTVPKGMS
ncbi:pilus assembly PilX N-terminal domain-containing protein [uncultured Phascolarctobacterium sp.]|uniref:pilus assembly PilX family protein n=1 Tax=Phascolarctobacterium sp. TaxID=2049039 RepID=UPI0026014D17|nr:pilus assembly PilX N-terminal domain-containing protein [uncultured Phascolarctobacterium sp.]